MHLITSLFLTSLSVISTSGLTLERSSVPVQGFSITQSQSTTRKTGPGLVREVYRKFNRRVPEHIEQAASGGQASVVSTPEKDDIVYLSHIDIGGQTLSVQLDTGSADLWVFSDQLSATQSHGHRLYQPGSSSTARKLKGSSWRIIYGDQSGAQGSVYFDNVAVGGITVTNQAIEVAQQVSPSLQKDTLSDGVFGLAFGSVNQVIPDPQRTFFENAIDQGVLAQNIFTADLKKGKPGTYNFGYIDHNAYSGSLIHTRVDSSGGFWNFTTTGFAVGNRFNSTRISGIADTGTTLLMLPDEVVDSYYSQIPSAKFDYRAGGYTVDCSATLPDFTLFIEHDPFKIPGCYMNVTALIGLNSRCLGGIQSSGGLGINIFGDVFLKTVFAVFDPSGPRLAFANKPLS